MSYSETLAEDAAHRLLDTVEDLRKFLEEELSYVYSLKESLIGTSKKSWCTDSIIGNLTDNYENEVDDNIDYLVRDLVPEYKKQLGGIDTLVDQLKEVQAFRKEYLKEAQNDNQN